MKLAERQRLMPFLMHLNEDYKAIRGQISLLDPLPSVNKAYSMVQRVETQRHVTENLTANREIAANVTRTQTNSFRDSDSTISAMVTKSGNGGARSRKNFKKNTGNKFCDHCQRSGHSTDQCFKIIRYPKWY